MSIPKVPFHLTKDLSPYTLLVNAETNYSNLLGPVLSCWSVGKEEVLRKECVETNLRPVSSVFVFVSFSFWG